MLSNKHNSDNVQTKEYNLQITMYPNVYTHHRLHSSNGNTTVLPMDLYEVTDKLWWYNLSRHTAMGKYDSDGQYDVSYMYVQGFKIY